MRKIMMCAVFLAIPLVCGAGEVPYSAIVLAVKGKVEVQRDRQKKPANLGCLLYPGDRVETAIGASVTVKYLESGLEEQWPGKKRFIIDKLASRQTDSSVKKKQGKIALPALKNPQSGASRFIEGEAPAPSENESPIHDLCPDGEGGASLERGDPPLTFLLELYWSVLSKRDNDANIHPALGELKAQVMMGRHYEGEYLALEKQYKRLHLAYFKEVDDGQGGTVPEGRKIYNATYAQVHGATKAAMQSQRPTQSRRAEAAELRRQMQDMKARGDIAGMMQKAKEFRSSPDQAMPGATAMRSMSEDTWDIWVRCLRDIDAVAYRTRIQYFPAAWR